MRRSLLLALCAVLVAGACGGKVSPQAILLAAPGKTEKAGSFRFSFNASVRGGPQSGEFSGEGDLDYRGQRGNMTFDLSSLGLPGASGGKVEMVFLGDVFFMKLPIEDPQLQGRPWLKMDIAALSRQSGVDVRRFQQLRDNDPSDALNDLRGVSDDVKTVGTERVRGTRTTHYRATINLDKAVQQVPPEQRDRYRRRVEQLGVKTLPTDVWVDEDGRLRRMRMEVDLSRARPQGADASVPRGTVLSTFELFDFGVKVNVQEPPPDQVTDISQLIQQSRQAPSS